MTLHIYRSRQVHKTLNGVNPSSSFRDMRSAKSGPNLWQIWQVFGPWASPYGANGQIIMTVHNYRPRQFHRTSNGENPSSGYRDMGPASLAAARPAARPPAHPPTRPPEPWRQYPSSPKGWGVKRPPTSVLSGSVTTEYSCNTLLSCFLGGTPNNWLAQCIPWICYERSFSEFYLFVWNQLVFNQRLQLFVQSPQP